MCGRFFLDAENAPDELQKIIGILQRRDGEAVKTGEIRPTDIAPVIANNRAMKPVPFAMRWGFSMQGAQAVINARSETAAQKPLFSDGVRQRRCLIPASLYFEWNRRGSGKTKYAIRCAGSDLVYMAGIYRREADRFAFTILTRSPAENIAFIHSRMPVLLSKDTAGKWLDLRFKAEDVLREADLNVAYQALGEEQLSFWDTENA